MIFEPGAGPAPEAPDQICRRRKRLPFVVPANNKLLTLVPNASVICAAPVYPPTGYDSVVAPITMIFSCAYAAGATGPPPPLVVPEVPEDPLRPVPIDPPMVVVGTILFGAVV